MLYVTIGAQVAVGLVFLSAAVSKCRSRRALAVFRDAFSQLVPRLRRHAAAIAAAVVTLEWATVVLIAVPGTALAGLAMADAILIVFTAVLASALRRGVATPCRCLGASDRPVSAVHVVRNGLLIAVATPGLAAAIVGGPSKISLVGGVVAAVAGVLVALGAMVLDDVVELFSDATPASDGYSPRVVASETTPRVSTEGDTWPSS